MKSIRVLVPLVIVTLFHGFSAPALSNAADGVDLIACRIEAEIETEAISETVTLHFTSKRPVKKLPLVFASCMEIESCTLNGANVPYERAGWDLDLNLAKAGSPKGEFDLVFKARGRPYNNQRNKFIRTTISAEHAYIRGQYAWYPRHDDDQTLYDTTLRARKDWLVRTAGDLEENREDGDHRIWRYVLKQPCRVIGLAAGNYVTVEKEGEGGIALDALVFFGHEEGAKVLLDATARAIKFYTDQYGPMSEKRFTLVEMPAAFGSGSGYGETGYSLIGTGAFEGGGSASWAEPLVAHEVAHTWWGREVGFTNFASEMLATYSTNRYLERFNGKEAAEGERAGFVKNVAGTVAEKGAVSIDKIQGFGSGLDPAIYSAHAYDKAAMMLRTLECEMGRDPFDKALKDLFQANRGRILDYQAVSKTLGGRKHKWIFQQWGGAEIPSLCEEHEVKKSGKGYSVKGELIQEGTKKPFRMNVVLRAVAGSETFDHTVQVKKAKTAFKFTCPFEPEKILIDPMHDLVFGKGGGDVDLPALVKKVFNVVNNPGMGDEAVLARTLKDLDKCIELGGGKKSECIAGKGRCFFRLGRLDEAKEELERAINMRDSGPFWRTWIYFRLGCIADLQKKRADAVDFYKQAVAVPKGNDFVIGKAELCLKKPYKSYKRDG